MSSGSAHAKLPLLLCIPAAMAVTLVSGIVLGAPTLRVRGDYLAIVTLGFGEIVRLILVNADTLTNGNRGISSIPTPPSMDLFGDPPPRVGRPRRQGRPRQHRRRFLKFSVVDSIPYYWLALTLVFLVLFLDWRMQNSRVGRAWEATREDEDAAELMGVPTFRLDLVVALHRREERLLPQVARVVDAAVGRRVDLDDVDRPRPAASQVAAAVALAARVGDRSLLAVERPRQDPGARRLAAPARAAEEVGVVDAIAGQRGAQRLRDVLLPYDLGEGLRPVAAIEREWGLHFP